MAGATVGDLVLLAAALKAFSLDQQFWRNLGVKG